MNADYEAAKRVALGLTREQKRDTGDDLWNIKFDDDLPVDGEIPFQFFERGLEPTEELSLQKFALAVYSPDYADDCRDAERRLDALKQALAASDTDALKDCLTEVPPEEWLSLIFLDSSKLKGELVPLLDSASDDCRKSFGKALDKALSHLVNFKDLMLALKTRC